LKPERKTRKKALLKKNRSSGISLKLLRPALLPLALSLVLLFVYFVAAEAKPAFTLRKVVFTGNAHLSDDELRNMAGLREGENLLSLSCRGIYGKLIVSPWIRKVSIRKELPDRLYIRVEESRPFALLDMNGRLFLMDDRGSLLEELRNGSVPFLPVITGDPYRERDAFGEAVKLVGAMKTTGVISRKEHIEIIAHKPEEMAANLDGLVVKVGAGDYEGKLARLDDLEEQIRDRNIPVDYIDLRFANRVVVKAVHEVRK
jgi:cell division protein FtsQ